MTFQAGQSGNPKGRAKGSLNKRTQLAKLLEPHAEELVAKMIELAMEGDVNALRLCIERLIPKIQHEPLGVEFSGDLTEKSMLKLKNNVLLAALEGKISVGDAEKLTKLLNDQYEGRVSFALIPELPTDAIQAAKIYQQIMIEK